MWLGVSVWGRGAVARGIFLHPLSSWITKNPFYLSHIHVILIPGNIPKTNLEVPHFLRPCLARFTTKTSQKWAKTRKKRYLCGQIHNPKLVFLVACTRLYKSLCRSIGPSVGRSPSNENEPNQYNKAFSALEAISNDKASAH